MSSTVLSIPALEGVAKGRTCSRVRLAEAGDSARCRGDRAIAWQIHFYVMATSFAR